MNKKDEGLEILLNKYWSNGGWNIKTIPESDFEKAKSEGYMFDYPKVETHDKTLKRLKDVLDKIDIKDIVNAFLYSLSTRKLEYRSALGSYIFAISIPKHKIDIGNENDGYKHCYLCGWYEWKKEPNKYEINNGLNIFNFERFKWGGVRHTYLDYALFDLEQFLKLPKVLPSEDDKKILKNILECVNKLDKKGKAGRLRDLIIKEKIFKCNKSEVEVILEILGICGILENKNYPTYYERFVNEYDRVPVEDNNDFNYPINRWSAMDGINYENFEKIFNYKKNIL